ncbi:hypothetical protein ABFA07_011945 [Porites harrisoni]
MSDVEKALEEITEKESDAENTVESNQKKADHAKAVEMRKRAMERIRSRKRKGGDEVEDEENAQPKPKITRRSGGETIANLCEKNDKAQKRKAEELELQKQRLEVESKQQDESRKQHQEMMQMMAHQVRQQQNQMHHFQQMFATMQQQQSQIILKLLEKRN